MTAQRIVFASRQGFLDDWKSAQRMALEVMRCIDEALRQLLENDAAAVLPAYLASVSADDHGVVHAPVLRPGEVRITALT